MPKKTGAVIHVTLENASTPASSSTTKGSKRARTETVVTNAESTEDGNNKLATAKAAKKVVKLSKEATTVKASATRAVATTSATAVPTPASLPVPDDAVWQEAVVNRFSRCASAEGIQATSYYRNNVQSMSSGSASGRSFCLRRLLQELASLDHDLPSNPAIWLRFDEEVPQYMRALVTGPSNTPYSFGLFCFDIYIPDSYPSVPPKFQLLTTGDGTVAFSPNLYSSGKVCLSLLNTWDGPKWNPQHSSLLQCLVSLQALILGVEHPYYLEPGRGGWEGHVGEAPTPTGGVASVLAMKTAQLAKSTAKLLASAQKMKATVKAASSNPPNKPPNKASSTAPAGAARTATLKTTPPHVQRFEDRIRMGTIQFAMLDMIRSLQGLSRHNYLKSFSDIIRSHFRHYKDRMIQETKMWANNMKSGLSPYMMTPQRMQIVKTLSEELSQLQPLQVAAGSANTEGKSDANAPGSSGGLEAIVAAKQRALKEAVAKEDYVTAGRLQTELLHGDKFGSVELKILVKRKEMEVAASKQDYITAGQLQASIQHLESNKKMLQDMERRMLEAASELDFVRAGRFQEQYKILLGMGEASSSSSSSSTAAAKPSSAYMTSDSSTTGGVTYVGEIDLSNNANSILGQGQAFWPLPPIPPLPPLQQLPPIPPPPPGMFAPPPVGGFGLNPPPQPFMMDGTFGTYLEGDDYGDY